MVYSIRIYKEISKIPQIIPIKDLKNPSEISENERKIYDATFSSETEIHRIDKMI